MRVRVEDEDCEGEGCEWRVVRVRVRVEDEDCKNEVCEGKVVRVRFVRVRIVRVRIVRVRVEGSLVPRPPPFFFSSSSVCVQYNTRKRKSAKNEVDVGGEGSTFK